MPHVNGQAEQYAATTLHWVPPPLRHRAKASARDRSGIAIRSTPGVVVRIHLGADRKRTTLIIALVLLRRPSRDGDG